LVCAATRRFYGTVAIMRAEDRTAISLGALGLGSNAVALSVPQLWPHINWIIWFSIFCLGTAIFSGSVLFLIYEHILKSQMSALLWRRAVYGAILLSVIGGISYYTLLPPPPQPLSLRDIYLTDFAGLGKSFAKFDIKDQSHPDSDAVRVDMRKLYNHEINAYFLAFFVPFSRKITDMSAYDACSYIVQNYVTLVQQYLPKAKMDAESPGDSDWMRDRDLKFTGRIYLYVEGQISAEQIGQLTTAARKEDVYLQMRSSEYHSLHWNDEWRREPAKVERQR
jgi:hypothetical protein